MNKELLKYNKLFQSHLGYFPPLVQFNHTLRGKNDKLDYYIDNIESFSLMLEIMPIFPFNSDQSYESGILENRKAIAYEITNRILSHIRSVVVNAAIFNFPAINVANRCILEIEVYLKYITAPERLNSMQFLDKILYGSQLRGSDIEKLEEDHIESTGEKFSNGFKNFMKTYFQLPHPNKFFSDSHEEGKEDDLIYSFLSDFIHPAFNRPREHYMKYFGLYDEDNIFDLNETYYTKMRKNDFPLEAFDFVLSFTELIVRLSIKLLKQVDPYFDNEIREKHLQKLFEKNIFTEEIYNMINNFNGNIDKVFKV